MTEIEQQQVFEQWLNLYKPLLFKVVRSYAVTAMDRDDLFQEIAIQVWNSIPRFRNESAVTTWLYRISLNTAIKWTTKERKHLSTEPLERGGHVLMEDEISIDDQLKWFYTELYKLHVIDRSLILLLLDGFSYKEMSDILGISESNVGVKINRVKKQLMTKSKNYDNYGI